MEFELRWINIPTEVEPTTVRTTAELKRSLGDAVLGRPSRDAALEGYVTANHARVHVFEFDLLSMADCVQVMEGTSMAYQSAPDPTLLAVEDLDDYLRSGVKAVGGVASHKLRSPQGWIVTELECRGALYAWRRWQEQERACAATPLDHRGAPLLWWSAWLEWLAAAAHHGGFSVNEGD
jgi:predicted enzyme related to lactoylglutathione lyase